MLQLIKGVTTNTLHAEVISAASREVASEPVYRGTGGVPLPSMGVVRIGLHRVNRRCGLMPLIGVTEPFSRQVHIRRVHRHPGCGNAWTG